MSESSRDPVPVARLRVLPAPPLLLKLALGRPASYSQAGAADDLRLAGACRPPTAMLFSPRRGLTVRAPSRERGSPLAALSAPKHAVQPTIRAARRAPPMSGAPRPPEAGGPAAAAAGCAPRSPRERGGSGAVALEEGEVRRLREAEGKLDRDLRRFRAHMALLATAAAGASGGEGGGGGGGGDVWARERPVLSHGGHAVRRWGGRVKQQHRAVMGQELIRGGLLPPAAAPLGAAATAASAPAAGGAGRGAVWRPPPASPGSLRQQLRGESDVPVAGGGRVSLAGTRAFMRGWRRRRGAARAAAAEGARAAAAAALAAAGRAEGEGEGEAGSAAGESSSEGSDDEGAAGGSS
ncbi:MAG: hypothetical protein J3K34DRAFT_472359 [Monoraphidium minutum]|nr:MAG: hypothetical protein J3K34DRAFT_472359 [Monoraphidium minutum]